MTIAASVGTPDYNAISLESAASRLTVHYRKRNRSDQVKRVWRACGEAIELTYTIGRLPQFRSTNGQ